MTKDLRILKAQLITNLICAQIAQGEDGDSLYLSDMEGRCLEDNVTTAATAVGRILEECELL